MYGVGRIVRDYESCPCNLAFSLSSLSLRLAPTMCVVVHWILSSPPLIVPVQSSVSNQRERVRNIFPGRKYGEQKLTRESSTWYDYMH